MLATADPPFDATAFAPRELEFVECKCEGLTDAEVAQRCDCSVNTVKATLRNAREKLGVTGMSDFWDEARRRGFCVNSRYHPAPAPLTDAQWARASSLIRRYDRRYRGPRSVHLRALTDGILWVLATGQRWRDLPCEFGNFQTAYRYYVRWRAQPLLGQLFAVARTAEAFPAHEPLQDAVARALGVDTTEAVVSSLLFGVNQASHKLEATLRLTLTPHQVDACSALERQYREEDTRAAALLG